MQYLFVVTYGRSGSTVLMNLLNAIEGYCIRGENSGILGSLAAGAHALRTAQEARNQPEDRPDQPWYGIDEVDTDAWEQTMAQEFARRILMPPKDATVIGCKEIRYTPMHMDDEGFDATMRFMATRFEGSRFLFNTRDALQVSRSGWWADPAKHKRKDVLRLIAQSDERFARWNQTLGDRAFLIDYAQYNGKPEGFRPMLDWLGADLSPQMVEEICAQRLLHVKDYEPEKTGIKNRLRGFLKS